MTAYPWLKLWNEAPTDPKWLAVADMAGSSPSIAWHTFSAALAFANEQPNRGSIAGFNPQVVASFCRVAVEEVKRVIQALREIGVLLGERIAKWQKRQTEKLPRPRSAAAERQARHRQKVAAATRQPSFEFTQAIRDTAVTPEPEALQLGVTSAVKEEEDPSGNSSSKDDELIHQSTEKSKENKENPEFEGWWALCPRKVGKGAARKAYFKARRRGVDWNTLNSGMRRYAVECRDIDPKFIKHPTSWLDKECWADEPIGATREHGVPQRSAPSRALTDADRIRIFGSA